MKKIFSTLLLVSMIAAVILPALAFAANDDSSASGPLNSCYLKNAGQLGETCSALGNRKCSFTESGCALCCTLNTVYTVTDWVFYLMMAVAVFMIIWAGISFATHGDNPEEVGKARNKILYAAVGVAVALLARAIPTLVRFVLAGGS
jgi:hypothetical protein